MSELKSTDKATIAVDEETALHLVQNFYEEKGGISADELDTVLTVLDRATNESEERWCWVKYEELPSIVGWMLDELHIDIYHALSLYHEQLEKEEEENAKDYLDMERDKKEAQGW